MDFKKSKDKIWLENSSGEVSAYVYFPEEKENVVNIASTVVDNSLRGQGVADKLLLALVDELKTDGRKAVPSCSYAVKWFDTHKEHSDLLFKKP
ncbi:MAG: N-acetyltransferase [Firmicutes bacterium]|nr:N-acetyltransferase [Bacillota bacterium]